MKNIFLTITLLAASFVSAQGNGDIVMFDFVKTTPGEQYNVILNEKWKELAQKRADEGTITGWDTWWRANATPESEISAKARSDGQPNFCSLSPGQSASTFRAGLHFGSYSECQVASPDAKATPLCISR